MGDRLLKSRSGVINDQQFQYDLTVTGNGTGGTFPTTRAVGRVYSVKDESNNTVWRMAFNINGTFSTPTFAPSFFITGVEFKAAANQAIAFFQGAAISATNYPIVSYTASGTNRVDGFHSVVATNYMFSGDVELNAKPSFVA